MSETGSRSRLNQNLNAMYILNIGLNNNPYSFDEISEGLDGMLGLSSPPLKALGQWSNNPEPTLVAYVNECTVFDIQLLCRLYTQDCIAVWSMDFNDGWLVYNPIYEDEKFIFDKEYFLM
jgi:hypothetical protein